MSGRFGGAEGAVHSEGGSANADGKVVAALRAELVQLLERLDETGLHHAAAYVGMSLDVIDREADESPICFSGAKPDDI